MKYINLIMNLLQIIVVAGLIACVYHIVDCHNYISDLEEVVENKCGSVADVIDESMHDYYDWGWK